MWRVCGRVFICNIFGARQPNSHHTHSRSQCEKKYTEITRD